MGTIRKQPKKHAKAGGIQTRKPKPPVTGSGRRGRKPRNVVIGNTLPPDPASEAGPEPGEGGERLRNAIDKRVSIDCKKIADALVDKSIAGDLNGTRMVIELTGAKTPRKKPVKHPRTEAMIGLWETGPKWQDLPANSERQSASSPEASMPDATIEETAL